MNSTPDNKTMRIGHSPDPDDAFMFYALAHDKIDAAGWKFEHILKDIETLNQWATEGKLEITAISVHAYAHVRDKYAMLRHGASMGEKYGPIVVAKQQADIESFKGKRIGIPGLMTSAYLEMRLILPEFEEVIIPFDEIMDEVNKGTVDAGLLIHEGQLTHEDEGLVKVFDVGEWWDELTGGLPLPLGVNAVRKDLGAEVCHEMSEYLRASIDYGLTHREEALDYALQWGRGMERDLADKFVGMYVNELTLDMGDDGEKAIRLLLEKGIKAGLLPKGTRDDIEFVV